MIPQKQITKNGKDYDSAPVPTSPMRMPEALFDQAPDCREPAVPLTRRERMVLELLANAHSNKEVAVALGISVRTAETYRARIMQKLHLHSMANLVRYAIRNGIVQP